MCAEGELYTFIRHVFVYILLKSCRSCLLSWDLWSSARTLQEITRMVSRNWVWPTYSKCPPFHPWPSFNLFKIWSSRGGAYEEYSYLDCDAVRLLLEPTFRRNLSPPSSREMAFLRSILQLLVISNVVPSSLILLNLMMEATGSTEK
jgi:hypothetical protein